MVDYAVLETVKSVGNLGKVRALERIEAMLQRNRQLRILDIGCAGPRPMQFWVELLRRYPETDLTGIDVAGIEAAQQIVAAGKFPHVKLQRLSAYEICDAFDPGSFDVVVATQVLEHIARPLVFLQNVSSVLRQGGTALWIFDSAHHGGKYSPGRPIVLLKKWVKRVLAVTGVSESHYDIPLYDREVERLYAAAGLTVREKRFYNIRALKFLENHCVSPGSRAAVLSLWYQLEEALNQNTDLSRPDSAQLFCGLYYELVKEPSRLGGAQVRRSR